MIKHLCLLSITVGAFTNISLAADFRRTHASDILLHAPTEEDIARSESESSPRKEINDSTLTSSSTVYNPQRKAYRDLAYRDLWDGIYGNPSENSWRSAPPACTDESVAVEDKQPTATFQSWPSKIFKFFEDMVQNIDTDELPIG
ncbi:hypothetical protein [Candidatus Odyssella thessalonicensis]|uniref:hypothetical protein n=1 Tax=Candidatus Odyssella thessalonicensis TaxID=84647 RepID=UPI000225BF8F|nr:hypothetical protein [Candidatus Odyssella thessalonicensis]